MARREEGFFQSKDQTRLFFQMTQPDAEPKGWVALLHGYADHLGRYSQFVDHLVGQGFGVFAMDYRGHGKSDGRRGFVKVWSDYLDDADVLWEHMQVVAGDLPKFLLGHSHGGLMALHFVLRRPSAARGLVLTAPYLQLAIKAPPAKVLAGRLVGMVVPWLPIKSELTTAHLSRDTAWVATTDADPLYIRTVTPGWFTQSSQAQAALAGKAGDIKLPLLCITGANDGVASTPATRAFFELTGSADKTLEEMPGMLHEVLNELGKEAVHASISRWISAHL